MSDEPSPQVSPAVTSECVADEPQHATLTPAVDPLPVPVPPADLGYTSDGVPTFDSVREKIETRYGTAVGAAELAAETPEGRSVDEQYEARQKAAAQRLDQIRASMHPESAGEQGKS